MQVANILEIMDGFQQFHLHCSPSSVVYNHIAIILLHSNSFGSLSTCECDCGYTPEGSQEKTREDNGELEWNGPKLAMCDIDGVLWYLN